MNEEAAIKLYTEITNKHLQCMDCVAYVPPKFEESSGDFQVSEDRCLSCRFSDCYS